MKLRTKLMLAFVFMSVVPLSVIVLYSYFSSLETLRMAALSEVSELTAEIGDRIETIRQDVGRGVEQLGTFQFSYLVTDTGEMADSEQFLSEVGLAMGAAAPFVDSLEFVPLPPEPTATVPEVAPVVAPEPPLAEEELTTTVESVVISLGRLAETWAPEDEGSETWIEGGEGQAVMAEIRMKSEVAGREVAERLVEIDMARLVEEANRLRREAESQIDKEQTQEWVAHRDEHERRVLMVEPMIMGDDETVWQPNLLEQEQVELMKERELESRRILGRDFDSSVEQHGKKVGRLRAQISARKVLEQVLHQAQRDEGEIPFAVDPEGNVYVAQEGDLERLEGLPLTSESALIEDGPKNLDDWVIVRLQDEKSGLVYGIARPLGQSLSDLQRTAGRNFMAGLGLVALALVGIAPLSRRITRDLQTLTEGAEELATGNLEVRLPVRSRDEVGHLARTFNRMAEDLQQNQHQLLDQERRQKEHEIERRLLEAENSRKGQELEDARQFQLSLLPKQLPVHPQLDIAVFMKTATEVGGDYYDFHLSPEGDLTAAIGDATGHGARAGTMVTVIKSLFTAEAGVAELSVFLGKASESIRRMELGRMAMALTLVRFQNGHLHVAAAGMPPILIHRLAGGTVEELSVESVPLGSMSQYQYHERQTVLSPGDTVLMMSDGFPELVNDGGEPLGYSAVHEVFEQSAAKPPQELIAGLASAAEEWSRGAQPSDDITFVVLQVKP
jgi:serine phosphatase RsbU (regulator of sigma subunit)